MDMTFTTSVMDATGAITTGTCTLGDIATWSTGTAPDSITSENQTRYITVSADTLDGYNTNGPVPACCRRRWTTSLSPMRCLRLLLSLAASPPPQPDGR